MGRSYTIADYIPNVEDSLRISQHRMVIFNTILKNKESKLWLEQRKM